MVIVPFVRMGPLPRSLAAEAYDCFMVGVRIGPNRIQVCRAGKCAIWQAPLGSFAPTEKTTPDDSVCRYTATKPLFATTISRPTATQNATVLTPGKAAARHPRHARAEVCAARGSGWLPNPSVALRGRGAARSGRKRAPKMT